MVLIIVTIIIYIIWKRFRVNSNRWNGEWFNWYIMSVSKSTQWAWKSDINADGNHTHFWRRTQTAAGSCRRPIQRRFQPERKEFHFEEEWNGCVIDSHQGSGCIRPLIQNVRLHPAVTSVHWFFNRSAEWLACYYYISYTFKSITFNGHG